jgi:hypothetical protein
MEVPTMTRRSWSTPTACRFGSFAEFTKANPKVIGSNDGFFLDIDNDGVQDPGDPPIGVS